MLVFLPSGVMETDLQWRGVCWPGFGIPSGDGSTFPDGAVHWNQKDGHMV